MGTVASSDGTTIHFDSAGAGPPVVFVSGALDAGEETGRLAAVLRDDFTVVTYSRRGRGESGDRAGSTVDDEIADLAAVTGTLEQSPALVGISSGAALALRAVAAGVRADRVVVFEVPFDTTDGAEEDAAEFAAALQRLVDEGDRDGTLELAMTAWGSPPELIAEMRAGPDWASLQAMAPTLLYDVRVLGDMSVPTAMLAGIRVPTLVVTSAGTGIENEGLPDGFYDAAADAVAAALVDGERVVMAAAGHDFDPDELGAIIADYLTRPTN